jgi:hypothetical protein
MRGKQILSLIAVFAIVSGCSRKDETGATGPAPAPPPSAPANVEAPPGKVRFVDGEGRPLREARLAMLSRESFDDKGRLRDDAVASSPDRIRVLVDDADASGSVTVGMLTLPLEGRLTRPFLLVGDKDDAAAGPSSVVLASAGGKLEAGYRGAPAAVLPIGPAAIHPIPIRFIASGPGLPASEEIEKAISLRLAQANMIWEPLGRRFTRGSVIRLDRFPGLFSIRGRAAGVDDRGRPSRIGLRIDGTEVSVAGVWRNDGAPMSPKATASALQAKAGRSHTFSVLDGLLAGDRESVVVRVRRADGQSPALEALTDGLDVAQAVTPLPSQLLDAIEVSPSAGTLTLEEIALLGSGKGAASEGIDVYIVAGLRALQARPTFKVHPQGLPPWATAGSALVSWTLLDAGGKHPYGLARILGELVLPGPPAAGDTLFAEPMSESPGVAAHKRVTAVTAAKIAERGRALSGQK